MTGVCGASSYEVMSARSGRVQRMDEPGLAGRQIGQTTRRSVCSWVRLPADAGFGTIVTEMGAARVFTVCSIRSLGDSD